MAHPESLKLDFELIVGALIERIDSRTLGALISGLSWAATHRRTYIPAGVLKSFSDSGSTDELDCLVSQGLLLAPDEHNLCHLGLEAWRMCNVGRLPIPASVRAAVFERDGHRCLKCGASERLAIDHHHPVALGGSDDIANLRTLCRSCNSRKGARV